MNKNVAFSPAITHYSELPCALLPGRKKFAIFVQDSENPEKNKSKKLKPASKMKADKILVVVDVQRDFFSPEGSLYVKGSETLPAKIAAIAPDYDLVVFTLDWHPATHCSFAAQGGPWPSHCVAYTQGAGLSDEFCEILSSKGERAILHFKGSEEGREQYGAFESLDDSLREAFESCTEIDVCGIAGDYCVKESTRNLLHYVPASKVSILTGCTRSIDSGESLEAFILESGIGRK